MRRKRGMLFLAAMAVLGLAVTVPAWANHSTPTGVNCSNFTFQEDAQAYFEAHPGDPEGLDGPIGPAFAGIQNVACEDLPRRGTAVTTTTVQATTTTTASASGGGTSSGGTSILPTTTTTVVSAPATASAPRSIALTG